MVGVSIDEVAELIADIIFCRFDVAIPEFFQNVHNITLHKKCV